MKAVAVQGLACKKQKCVSHLHYVGPANKSAHCITGLYTHTPSEKECKPSFSVSRRDFPNISWISSYG